VRGSRQNAVGSKVNKNNFALFRAAKGNFLFQYKPLQEVDVISYVEQGGKEEMGVACSTYGGQERFILAFGGAK
jgi:hypothetical protein